MKLGISLFSSGGIADLAMRACGVHILVANELLPERAEVFKTNYPSTCMIMGDINIKKYAIINMTKEKLAGRKLDIVFATPPCQGMSKNGRGKLLSEVRCGKRGEYDPRNSLIIPTIEIIKTLSPQIAIFENVPEMENTIIEYNHKPITILQYIQSELTNYYGKWDVVEFADYGVPERRQRLITIFTKNANIINCIKHRKTFLPPKTHNESGSYGLPKWRTVRDAISHLPPLDAKNKKLSTHPNIAYHRVPLLDKEKYFWVENTPEGKSAFDNQCPYCRYNKTKGHGATKVNGINQSNKDTPIYCQSCGKLLPRPWVKEGDHYRIMKGYTSAYKRMAWDSPAPALTRNMSYACSDNKLHPSQNRVLSLYEAFILHTISEYEYSWKSCKGKDCSDKTIREIIGESIPPKGFEIIIKFILQLYDSKAMPEQDSFFEQLSLLPLLT